MLLQVYEAVVVDNIAVVDALLFVLVVSLNLSKKLLGHLASH